MSKDYSSHESPSSKGRSKNVQFSDMVVNESTRRTIHRSKITQQASSTVLLSEPQSRRELGLRLFALYSQLHGRKATGYELAEFSIKTVGFNCLDPAEIRIKDHRKITDPEIVDLYMRIYSRFPTADEKISFCELVGIPLQEVALCEIKDTIQTGGFAETNQRLATQSARSFRSEFSPDTLTRPATHGPIETWHQSEMDVDSPLPFPPDRFLSNSGDKNSISRNELNQEPRLQSCRSYAGQAARRVEVPAASEPAEQRPRDSAGSFLRKTSPAPLGVWSSTSASAHHTLLPQESTLHASPHGLKLERGPRIPGDLAGPVALVSAPHPDTRVKRGSAGPESGSPRSGGRSRAPVSPLLGTGEDAARRSRTWSLQHNSWSTRTHDDTRSRADPAELKSDAEWSLATPPRHAPPALRVLPASPRSARGARGAAAASMGRSPNPSPQPRPRSVSTGPGQWISDGSAQPSSPVPSAETQEPAHSRARSVACPASHAPAISRVAAGGPAGPEGIRPGSSGPSALAAPATSHGCTDGAAGAVELHRTADSVEPVRPARQDQPLASSNLPPVPPPADLSPLVFVSADFSIADVGDSGGAAVCVGASPARRDSGGAFGRSSGLRRDSEAGDAPTQTAAPDATSPGGLGLDQASGPPTRRESRGQQGDSPAGIGPHQPRASPAAPVPLLDPASATLATWPPSDSGCPTASAKAVPVPAGGEVLLSGDENGTAWAAAVAWAETSLDTAGEGFALLAQRADALASPRRRALLRAGRISHLDVASPAPGTSAASAAADTVAAVAACLATHATLEVVRLCGVGLGEAPQPSIAPLAAALTARPGLARLDLSRNALADCAATLLSRCLAASSGGGASLVELRLWGNRIGPAGARALADGLRRNGRLRELDLSHNPVGPAGAACIGMALHFNTALRRLNLDSCDTQDVGALFLAEALRPLCSNDVYGQEMPPSSICSQLPPSMPSRAIAPIEEFNGLIRRGSSVCWLGLADNGITDGGAAALADALKERAGLTRLNLSDNRVGPELQRVLGAWQSI